MLRQVLILLKGTILFQKNFGIAISAEKLSNIYYEILEEIMKNKRIKKEYYEYINFRIIFRYDEINGLMFLFIADNFDDLNVAKEKLNELQEEFVGIFGRNIEGIDSKLMAVMDPIVDLIHRKLKTKISLVGFSGVGKTTLTNLICASEIPTLHIPTITGKVSTIKIGKLHFHLWDFAGQEQFSYLWKNFILGSDVVLVITNSTLDNVLKSNEFIELINEHVPYAHVGIIGNKQDLPEALHIDEIREVLGFKTYAMVGIDPNNREKMIRIIADILEIDTDISPLLKPLFERNRLMSQARISLENGDIGESIKCFEKISNLCLELGDDALYKEFYEKAVKLKSYK